jgi:hypothetical protein
LQGLHQSGKTFLEGIPKIIYFAKILNLTNLQNHKLFCIYISIEDFLKEKL